MLYLLQVVNSTVALNGGCKHIYPLVDTFEANYLTAVQLTCVWAKAYFHSHLHSTGVVSGVRISVNNGRQVLNAGFFKCFV